jgi:hypothetical protein
MVCRINFANLGVFATLRQVSPSAEFPCVDHQVIGFAEV